MINVSCRVTRRTRRKENRKKFHTTLARLMTTTQKADEGILQMIADTEGTQVSSIEQTKPDDVVRVFFENFNSLCLFQKGKNYRKKIKRLRKLAKKYDVDVICGVETQTDWRFAKPGEVFDNLLFRGEERRSVVGNNTAEQKACKNQQGGTAMMVRGRLSGMVMETGRDGRKLGRWCWIKVGTPTLSTYIVTAYVPCDGANKNSAGERVIDQHRRVLEASGELRKPNDVFHEELVEQILDWKTEGSNVVLCGDFNENVYTDKLAQRLAEPDIGITEQVLKASGIKIPSTHERGSRPLCAIYATGQVESVAATVLKRYVGLGDHRVLMVDLKSSSITGDRHPRIVSPAARMMNSGNKRHRDMYNKTLEELCDRHRMHGKLLRIHEIPLEKESDFLREVNKWDKELEEFMKSAEKRR